MKNIMIHRSARPLDVDGDLSKDPWDHAVWYSDFTVLGDPSRTAESGTSFAMAHDGETLVVAVKVEEPDVDRVDARKVKKQRDVWSFDHVELFVDGGGRGLSCAQVGATSQADVGQVWRRGRAENYEPDLGARVAARLREDSWWAQIALPLSALDLSSGSNAWKVNVARVRVLEAEVPQFSTFAPIGTGAFYEPQAFATAQVNDLDSADYMWEVKLHGPARVVDHGGGFKLRQKLRISNLSGGPRAVAVRCRLQGEKSQTLPLSDCFAPGEQQDPIFEAQIPTEAFGRLYVTIEDRESARTLRRCVCDPEQEEFSWKEHRVQHGDGRGGFVSRPAQYQFIARYQGARVVPYGLARMDNGEIVLAGSAIGEAAKPATVLAFSSDGGTTWSDYLCVEDCGAPMMLTYLGKGGLAFRSSWQRGGAHYFFSRDYGRTWPEKAKVSPSPDGHEIACEGNPLVDRDDDGVATLLAETGQTHAGDQHVRGCLHWSRDGGRTWQDFSYPEAWNWHDTYAGRTIERGSGEGGLVRAANGWLVAAMRMDGIGRYVKYQYDQFEGTGISISKDEGKTWSPIQRVCEAGRMHANLIRLPNDDLIMTVIRRMDIRGGRLASYRRGCDAFVSHDHGQTWDPDEMIIIDDWPHHDPDQWYGSVCGHLYSTVLDDGSVLTGYSHHAVGGVLIRWRP